MPPAQLASILDQARTYLQLESDHLQETLSPICGQPRKVSQRTAAIHVAKGGAIPPQNLASLASKGANPPDYIRARQQQMKRGRDDR